MSARTPCASTPIGPDRASAFFGPAPRFATESWVKVRRSRKIRRQGADGAGRGRCPRRKLGPDQGGDRGRRYRSQLDSPLREALEAGLDLVSGMHSRLSDVQELANAARRHRRRLVDVRHSAPALAVGSGQKAHRQAPAEEGALTAPWARSIRPRPWPEPSGPQAAKPTSVPLARRGS